MGSPVIRINHPGLKKTKKIREKQRMEITEAQMVELLRARHKDRQWVGFPEMTYSTLTQDDKKEADQRIDFWAMNLWASRNFERITYEIKISRHDFLREMRKPEKRLPGLHISNRFYYIIPHGCVDESEVPAECGLIVVKKPKGRDYYALVMVKKAPWRDVDPPLGIDFWASMARRVNRDEGEYIDHYDRKKDQQEKKRTKKKGSSKKTNDKEKSSSKTKKENRTPQKEKSNKRKKKRDN